MPIIDDRQSLIKKQIDLTSPETVDYGNGSAVHLKPGKCLPACDNEEQKLDLNGQWSVWRWPFSPDEKTLAEKGVDDGEWESVRQPGPVFAYDPETDPRTVKNWDRVKMTHIDNDDGAMLRKMVTLPANWRAKKIMLRFDAVYPAGRFYCNGHYLGEHLSGLTPVEYDVTDLVTSGEPVTVAVRLLRKHKYVQIDMPRHACEFAGISQDVYFYALESVHINEYALQSLLEPSLDRGTVHGGITLKNESQRDCAATLELTCVDLRNGNTTDHLVTEVQIAGGAIHTEDVVMSVLKPALWNDEYPHLYDLRMALKVSGQPEQQYSFRTGFRLFESRNSRPFLNGHPVKFRGVNHLTFHPEGGMYTPKEWLRKNLVLMKKANVNCIRTHFLGAPALAELCDELGIYLMQELPIDWGHDYVHDPDWLGPILTRLDGGVRRDRHHVSIMVWSIGNENMPKTMDEYDDFMNHLQLFDELVKKMDPTRFTMFPPPGPANKIEGIFETRLGDIADTHYSFRLVRKFNETGRFTSPKTWKADMETFTREEALENGWSGIWFSSEYGIQNNMPDTLNAPYSSIITDTPEDPLSGKNTLQVFMDRLNNEWGYMRDDPSCLGGAYFPWLCSGWGNNPWGWVRWSEDADWGIVTADLTPKPQFWGMRIIFSPVRFPSRYVMKKNKYELVFKVTNHYNAVDLKECTLRTGSAGGGKYMTMMRNWQDIPMDCAPGQTTTLTIPIWNESSRKVLDNGGAFLMRCILLDPNGFRPLTHDILVIPEEQKDYDEALPVGPDAEF